MTVLVTGATGNVGRHVVDLLLGAGESVRAVTRRPDSAGLPDGVDVRGGDLSDAAGLADAFTGVDRLYLFADGDTAGLLDQAKRAGVRRVVTLSSVSVLYPDNAIGDHHRVVEEAVEASGLPWTHIRPGMFATNLLGWWAPTIRAEGVVREPYAAATMEPIHPRDIAQLAVDALLSAEHEGTARALTGERAYTKSAAVRVIAEATGRDLRFEEISEQEYRDRVAGTLPAPFVEAILATWRAGAGRVPGVPRSTRTFTQWVTENVQAFR
ncbi:NAD-dependent epimerase/dehydratase family protein [Pseudonocardiaceae bacterium YIM PH 21723]|nr:NAD-dependent epimerase/dehydratase family protein [Pseudonocardiaceae bacterium YIM PH 21723]